MNKISLIIFKVFLLLVLLVGMNYIYTCFFFEKDLQAHSEVINKVRDAVNEKPEIIYIGESSNTTFREDDIDQKPISAMISDYFPSKKFGTITKEASHAGIYYELLRNIPEKAAVKTVIVTMNLRSFDASWIFSDLETPLQKSIVLLKAGPPLWNRLLLSFKGYDIKTSSERKRQIKRTWKHDIFPYTFKYKNAIEWDHGMAARGVKNADGSKNIPLTELACHYIKAYAFQINTCTNPRIRDFDKIVVLAKQRHWKLVLNLMAENTAMADSIVGKELIRLMQQNATLLVNRYNKAGVYVVNNLDSLLNNDFIDQTWTTEHYAEHGRRVIARNTATCLRQWYPNAYEKPFVPEPGKTNVFFNDCEGHVVWGQMNTRSKEKSVSGKWSSKTGLDQHFGITFEYAVKNLPDSLKNVAVEFELYQSTLDTSAGLMIELLGEQIPFYSQKFPLINLSNTTGIWKKVAVTFPLPVRFYKAELIKIYLYNPSPTIRYTDDTRIHFLN